MPCWNMRKPKDRKEISELFSEIATSYDRLNHLLSFNLDRWWRRRLAELANSKPGAFILDLCTGTGDVALRLARRGAEQVIGVDLSDQMLKLCRAKLKQQGLESRVFLLKADALNLPFKDEVFDVVTLGFGLRNLLERERAVSEIVRVLKRGGRALALEFSLPKVRPFRRLYCWYLRWGISFLGGILSCSREAYRYLYASILEFSRLDVLKLFEAAGLSKLFHLRLNLGIVSIYQGQKEGNGTLLPHRS